jgi:hypothetical protein
MEDLVWKLRISMLWIFLAVGMSAAMILFIMGPGVVEDLMSGQMEGMEVSGWLLILFSIFWIIPLIMAYLTLVLKNSVNRYTNVILGLFFGIFYIVDMSGHISKGEAFSGHVIMGVVGIIVAFLISWHAWKWPKVSS